MSEQRKRLEKKKIRAREGAVVRREREVQTKANLFN